MIPQCNYCATGLHFLCIEFLVSESLCCCTIEQEVIPVTVIQQNDSKPQPVVIKHKITGGKVPKTKREFVRSYQERQAGRRTGTIRNGKVVNRGRNNGRMGRPEKTIGEFDDVLSSGRKRANKLYPIQDGQLCEWAWKTDNGGGIVPVTGCSGRLAKHVHHGPDKSTLNNDRSNISIICTFCHQLWHARNDRYYEGERPADGSTWLPTTRSIDGGRMEIRGLDESRPTTISQIIAFELSIDREMTVEDWERIRSERESTGEIIEGAKG